MKTLVIINLALTGLAFVVAIVLAAWLGYRAGRKAGRKPIARDATEAEMARWVGKAEADAAMRAIGKGK